MARARIRAFLIQWKQHQILQYRYRREQDQNEFLVFNNGKIKKYESLEYLTFGYIRLNSEITRFILINKYKLHNLIIYNLCPITHLLVQKHILIFSYTKYHDEIAPYLYRSSTFFHYISNRQLHISNDQLKHVYRQQRISPRKMHPWRIPNGRRVWSCYQNLLFLPLLKFSRWKNFW